MSSASRCLEKASFEGLQPLLLSLARPFLQMLAVELAAEMARARVDLEIDQRSPALAELRISPRMYLEAARRGEFPSSKRGKRLTVARRRHVEAWLERRSRPCSEHAVPHPQRAEPLLEEEARMAIGLPPKRLRALQGGRSR